MGKLTKFLTLGLIAISVAYASDKVANDLPLNEITSTVGHIKSQENLDTNIKFVKKDLIDSYSFHNKNNEHTVNLGIGSTNLVKVFSPIDSLRANTKGVYTLIALHEFSHGELENMMFKKEKIFDLNLPNTNNDKINELISESFANNPKSILTSNFHENFADAYGSILLIRNLQNQYSDQQIKNIITSRYNQTKNQNEMAFGAFGDFSHRTDIAIKQIMDLPFEQIRALSPNSAKHLAINAASNCVVKKFPDLVQNQIINNYHFQKDLTKNDLINFTDFVDSKEVKLNLFENNSKLIVVNKIESMRQTHFNNKTSLSQLKTPSNT
jgi:hypothetical protein